MATTDPLINTRMGDYKIVDLLGRGGMARVYRGYDENLQRYAAVKVIDVNLTLENEVEYRERFQREARSIARLHHPAIVSVYQFGEVNGVYYMAMAFIDGRDLSQILRETTAQSKMLSFERILTILRDIAGALDHAHREGVIHRDVKPSNIMVMDDDHAVLTDFGLALSLPEGTIGNTFGSAHYIAPEQAVSSANAVPQSDLYSLGIVLYQMLVGKVPFDDPSAMSVALKHLSDAPPPPRSINGRVSPEIEAVVLQSLAKEPGDRYATGADMVAAFERALAGTDDLTGSRPIAASKPVAPTGSRPQPLDAAPGDELPTSGQQSAPRAPSVTHPSRPQRIDLSQAQPTTRQTRRVLILTILLLGLLGLGGLLFVVVNSPAEPPTPTPAVVSAADQTKAASASAEAVSISLTDEVTSTATGTPTDQATNSATDTDEPTPSRTPAATDTAEPTPTADATAAATEVLVSPLTIPSPTPDPQIILRYDSNSLVLFNNTDRSLNIFNLEFVQVNADGDRITFEANDWNDARRLSAGVCFRVWRNTFRQLPLPEYCASEASANWRAVARDHWFWISSEADDTFTVERGDEVLTTCSIDAGECAFSIRP